MRSSLIPAACVATLLSLTAVADAQNQPPSSDKPSGAAPAQLNSSNISESKLDAAATAVKNVSTVKDDYEQKIARAPDGDKERLAAEGTQALSKAVTDSGLSVAEYTAIMEVAQNDPVVRDKILQRLK
jgi:Flp pilus assembly protein TadD